MKPLIVLLITFVVSVFGIRLINGIYDLSFAGNIAMSVMLVFTAIGHFAYGKGMEMMLPESIPFKKFMIFITGILELLAALGLLIPSLREITSWLLIIFFVLILPANIYAAVKKVDYQKGTNSGPGTRYLWFRLPLQMFFIGWVYVSNLN